MHKLKSSQKDKVKKFIAFTQTGESTAIYCLSQNDWKLELASDNFFQNPDLYFKEPKISVDRRKLEQLFSKYKVVLSLTMERHHLEPEVRNIIGIMIHESMRENEQLAFLSVVFQALAQFGETGSANRRPGSGSQYIMMPKEDRNNSKTLSIVPARS